MTVPQHLIRQTPRHSMSHPLCVLSQIDATGEPQCPNTLGQYLLQIYIAS